jgi:ABC-type antimicrobial peptide transport system permease subunit
LILRLVGASLRRRPRQLALISAAVLVAAATVATLAGFSARAGQRLGERLAVFGPNLLVRPQVGGPPALPAGASRRVAAVPGVLSVKIIESAAPIGDGSPSSDPLGPAGRPVLRLEVRAEPGQLESVAQQIEGRVEGVEASPVQKTSASDARLIHRLTLVLLAISGVSFLLALISVGAATTALVGERRVEIGLMLALGLSGRRVGGLLAAELLTAALLAALAGAFLGELAAGRLEHQLLGGGAGLSFTWSGLTAAAAVGALVVGVSLIAALWRIEGVDAARVLRGE